MHKKLAATKATHGTTAVHLAFPDVCHTPAPPGGQSPGTPIPYPPVATKARKVQAQKTAFAGKSSAPGGSAFKSMQGNEPGTATGIVSSKTLGRTPMTRFSSKVMFEGKNVVDPMAQAEAANLRSRLGTIGQQLQALETDDPDEWQKLLEQYLVAASALYVTLHG